MDEIFLHGLKKCKCLHLDEQPVIYLRIMQERPRGQKKPGQHAMGSVTRMGIVELFSAEFGAMAAFHPASHARPHDDELQFSFGGGVSKFPRFLKYAVISTCLQRRLATVPSTPPINLVNLHPLNNP